MNSKKLILGLISHCILVAFCFESIAKCFIDRQQIAIRVDLIHKRFPVFDQITQTIAVTTIFD